jgi:tripeptide aminopeptidase
MMSTQPSATAMHPHLQPDRLLNWFLEMVQINSPSGEEAAMCAYLKAWCDQRGYASQVDAEGNLIAEVPAIGCEHNSILVLSGHMDVVPPCLDVKPIVSGEGIDRLVQSDNTTVLGADDKAGLAVLMEALQVTEDHQLPRPSIRLIFTTREETQLQGAKGLSDEVLKAGFAVTLDHTGVQGTIIHQAPSYAEFKITCHGKSVHAGIMPEKGVNAIHLASQIINQMHLGRIDAETTANLGFIQGGKATNIVPDKVVIEGELRSLNPKRLQEEIDYLQTLVDQVGNKFPTDIPYEKPTFWWQECFTAYRIPPDDPLLQRVIKACESAGLVPNLIHTNGGSDNNVFVHRGLPGVVLSAGYVAPHSLKEQVYLKELLLSTGFVLEILTQFSLSPFSQETAI